MGTCAYLIVSALLCILSLCILLACYVLISCLVFHVKHCLVVQLGVGLGCCVTMRLGSCLVGFILAKLNVVLRGAFSNSGVALYDFLSILISIA